MNRPVAVSTLHPVNLQLFIAAKLLFRMIYHSILIANIVTTSKALVTSSDALVPSSFLSQILFLILSPLLFWLTEHHRIAIGLPGWKPSLVYGGHALGTTERSHGFRIGV